MCQRKIATLDSIHLLTDKKAGYQVRRTLWNMIQYRHFPPVCILALTFCSVFGNVTVYVYIYAYINIKTQNLYYILHVEILT